MAEYGPLFLCRSKHKSSPPVVLERVTAYTHTVTPKHASGQNSCPPFEKSVSMYLCKIHEFDYHIHTLYCCHNCVTSTYHINKLVTMFAVAHKNIYTDLPKILLTCPTPPGQTQPRSPLPLTGTK